MAYSGDAVCLEQLGHAEWSGVVKAPAKQEVRTSKLPTAQTAILAVANAWLGRAAEPWTTRTIRPDLFSLCCVCHLKSEHEIGQRV